MTPSRVRPLPQAVPPPARERAQSHAFHPTDLNLYAVGITDGTLIVKNFQLEQKYQRIGEGDDDSDDGCGGGDESAADQPPPPPHVFFTPSGEYLVLCKTSPGPVPGAPSRTTLQAFHVPTHAVNPTSTMQKSPGEKNDEYKQRKQRATEEWKHECQVNNRADHLVSAPSRPCRAPPPSVPPSMSFAREPRPALRLDVHAHARA